MEGGRGSASTVAHLEAAPGSRRRRGGRISKLLDAVIECVRDIDAAGGVCGQAKGQLELPIGAAVRAPLGKKAAGVREHLHAAVLIRHIDMTGAIGCDGAGPAEFSVAAAVRSPLREEDAGAGVFLNAMVRGVSDV